MESTYRVNYTKTCKARLTKGDETVVSTEILYELTNGSIMDLFDGMTTIGSINKNTSNLIACNELNLKKIFVCEYRARNFIRRFTGDKSVINYNSEYSQRPSKNNFICEISGDNIRNQSDVSLYNRINGVPFEIYGYLEGDVSTFLYNGAKEFCMTDTMPITKIKFTIVPELGGVNSFTYLYVDERNRILDITKGPTLNDKINRKRLLIELLSKMQFNFHLNGDPNNYPYKDIMYFTPSDESDKMYKIDILEEIKKSIMMFINSFLGEEGEYDDENMVHIVVRTSGKFKFIWVEFAVINKYVQHKYRSFIDLFSGIEINTLIDRIKTGGELSFYARVPENKTSKEICGKSHVYQWYRDKKNTECREKNDGPGCIESGDEYSYKTDKEIKSMVKLKPKKSKRINNYNRKAK